MGVFDGNHFDPGLGRRVEGYGTCAVGRNFARSRQRDVFFDDADRANFLDRKMRVICCGGIVRRSGLRCHRQTEENKRGRCNFQKSHFQFPFFRALQSIVSVWAYHSVDRIKKLTALEISMKTVEFSRVMKPRLIFDK